MYYLSMKNILKISQKLKLWLDHIMRKKRAANRNPKGKYLGDHLVEGDGQGE